MNDSPVTNDDDDDDEVNPNNDKTDETQTEKMGNCIQLIDRETVMLSFRFQNPNRTVFLFMVDVEDDEDDDDEDLDDDSPKLIDCDRVSKLDTGYTCPCRCLGIDSRQPPNINDWILANMIVAFIVETNYRILNLYACMNTHTYRARFSSNHSPSKSVLLKKSE